MSWSLIEEERSLLVSFSNHSHGGIRLEMRSITLDSQGSPVLMPVEAPTMDVVPVANTAGVMPIDLFKSSGHR